MGEPRGCHVHLPEVVVELARPKEPDLELGGFHHGAPGEGESRDGHPAEEADDGAQPKVPPHDGIQGAGREDDHEAVEPLLGDHRLVILLAHPGRASAGARPSGTRTGSGSPRARAGPAVGSRRRRGSGWWVGPRGSPLHSLGGAVGGKAVGAPRRRGSEAPGVAGTPPVAVRGPGGIPAGHDDDPLGLGALRGCAVVGPPEVHQVDEGDRAGAPPLPGTGQVVNLDLGPGARGGHHLAVYVVEGDRFHLVRLDQFPERGLEPLLGDDAAEPALGADHQAEGGRDVMAPEDEGLAGGLPDPEMLRPLPGEDRHPGCEQQPVDQGGAPSHGLGELSGAGSGGGGFRRFPGSRERSGRRASRASFRAPTRGSGRAPSPDRPWEPARRSCAPWR